MEHCTPYQIKTHLHMNKPRAQLTVKRYLGKDTSIYIGKVKFYPLSVH